MLFLDYPVGWGLLLYSFLAFVTVRYFNRELGNILLAAFLFRAVLALTNIYIMELPGGDRDAVRFERQGWQLSEVGFPQILDYFRRGSWVYPWFIGVVYTFTDRDPLLIQGINVLFGTLVVLNIYKTTKLLWGERVAIRSGWITAFLPTVAIYSALIVREVMIIYPMTLGIYYVVKWLKKENILHLIPAVLLLMLSTIPHSGLFIAVIGLGIVIILQSIISFFKGEEKALVNSFAIIIAGGLVMYGVLNSELGQERLDAYERSAQIEELEASQAGAARGRAAYPDYLTVGSNTDLIIKTPLRLIYFLFTPFIWMVRHPLDLVSLIDAFIFIILAISIFKSRKMIMRSPPARSVFIIVFLLILIFAINVSNYGNAIRHRNKFSPVMACLFVTVPFPRMFRFFNRSMYNNEEIRYVEYSEQLNAKS